MRKYKNSAYFTMSVIGALIRTCYLVNAFDYYFGTDGFNGLIALCISATIGEFLLSRTSFMAVGIIYKSGDAPTFGSILYTVFYIVNNFLMVGICWLCRLVDFDF